MTRPSDYEDYGNQRPGETGRRRSVPGKWRVAVAFMGLVALAAGCGGPNGPAVSSSGPSTGKGASTSTRSSSGVMAQALAYARAASAARN